MKQIIAITNQKGGVGKSTTAQALGAGYRQRGFSVLFIDLDAQGNLSYTLGASAGGYTILEVLSKEIKASQAIQGTPSGDLIAYSPALSGADLLLGQTGKEYRLREAIQPILDKYDYIILDTPPALGILTVNALTACTWAIIPAQADTYSLQGIGQLYSTIEAVRRYCNPSLVIRGILLTRHSNRTILSRDIAELMEKAAKEIGTTLFTTTIRQNIAVKEAQSYRQDIFSYAPKSNAAIDYRDLIEELEEGNE
ncbi:MAG: ParA family protein [Bacteroidia bacterium]|jgi:chromosome partitioning protein|nr:ParA family protein [Candidatus Cloacimonadota bacterium]MDX9796754.1 ParA family protein [Arcobacteraceae bacterium]NCC11198.1 ParA family protein [Bacteroidia bacterium]